MKQEGRCQTLFSSLIGRKVAVDVITANEPPKTYAGQKHVRLDISCKTKEGELVNVEMSFTPKVDEPTRLEYYTTISYTGQNVKGKKKKYKNLKETYRIAILAEKSFFPDENLIQCFLYYDPKTQVSLGGKTRIITVELVKTKPIVEKPIKEMTKAELWAVFFQYLTDEGKRAKIMEIIKQEEGIAMAVEALSNITQEEIDFFTRLSELKYELDKQNDEAYAIEEAEEKAREKAHDYFLELLNQDLTKEEIKERLQQKEMTI